MLEVDSDYGQNIPYSLRTGGGLAFVTCFLAMSAVHASGLQSIQAQNNESVADWIKPDVDHFDQQIELPSSVEIFLQPAIALYHTSFLSQAFQ